MIKQWGRKSGGEATITLSVSFKSASSYEVFTTIRTPLAGEGSVNFNWLNCLVPQIRDGSKFILGSANGSSIDIDWIAIGY